MPRKYTVLMGVRVTPAMAERINKEMEASGLHMTEIVRRALAIYLGDK